MMSDSVDQVVLMKITVSETVTLKKSNASSLYWKEGLTASYFVLVDLFVRSAHTVTD